MNLKMIVDSLEDVPEALRDLYAPTDDKKFRLGVEGVEDPKALKKALQAERDARAEYERKLKAYEGLDPEDTKAFIARFANDEEMKLIKEGKLDVVKEKWVEKLKGDYEKKLKVATDAIGLEAQKAGKYQAQVLDNAVRQAAAKVGVHPPAVEDALFRARAMFSLDESGNAVQVREGSVVMGKDGKTPYSPVEWLESMREAAPHWFPAMAAGSGASQSKGSGSNGQARTVKRATFDGWTPKEKAAYSKEGGAVID